MVTLALALLLAQTPQHRLFLQPNLPQGPDFAFFEAFPANGAGTNGACSTTPPTAAKGEALTFARASVAECYSNDGQTVGSGCEPTECVLGLGIQWLDGGAP